jgi:NAD(P)H dehydrogenase (quinone)
MTKNIVAVTGSTGAQGAAIAQAFTEAGWQVRPLRRDSPLAETLEGVEVLAVTLPIDYRRGVREAWLATLLVEAAAAGVRRIVLNLAARPLPGHQRPVSASLRQMEAMVLAGPVPAVVLRPTIYMDNLLQPWVRDAARQGGALAYPMPAALPLNWLSHRTLGQTVLAAATRADITGRGYDIAGPGVLTGPEVAALLGRAMGLELTYAPLPLPAFAAGLNAVMGAPNGDDIADTYAHLPQVPWAMQGNEGNAALGVVAESFEAWFARQDFAA